MNALIKFTKSIPIHVRWLFMSEEERYAYLWGITRKAHGWDYITPKTMAIQAHNRR